VQLPEGASEPFEVGSFSAHNAVGVLSWPLGSIGKSGGSADNQVLDLVAI
jgi:hypothetical protein